MRLKYVVSKTIGTLRAMNITMEFPLLDLPDELIALVVSFVSDKAILRCLASTCHRLQPIAEGRLHRHLLIRTSSTCRRMVGLMQARPDRAIAIHSLNFACDPRQWRDSPQLTPAGALLLATTNLREFKFESPACNSSTFERDAVWQQMSEQLFFAFREASISSSIEILPEKPLQRLQKLQIHLNGPRSPYWTLDERTLAIFLLPNLRELKLSCVNILGGVVDISTQRYITPLKHLDLEECNITHRGFLEVLALPKALETLSLGENHHNLRNFPNHEVSPISGELFARNAELALQALYQQRHSLEALAYAPTPTMIWRLHHHIISRSQVPPVDAGFSEFPKLSKITLSGKCPNFERAVISVKPPPNLTHLTYKEVHPLGNPDFYPPPIAGTSFVPFIGRNLSVSIPPTLQYLDIVFLDADVEETPDLTDFMRLRETTKTAATFGVKVRAYAESRGGGRMTAAGMMTRYFPPILYGEPEATEELVFENGEITEAYKKASTQRELRDDHSWASSSTSDDDDDDD